MGSYQEIEGNLITLALKGNFDIITHGCNCFCTMGAGIAPQMAKAFGCDKFKKENRIYSGDINKLGTIEWKRLEIQKDGKTATYHPNLSIGKELCVVNSYTQFHYGRYNISGNTNPVDYEALTLCMRKINYTFKGKHIGLPKIGAGLAGGNWDFIKHIIKKELKDMDITVVIYKP